MHSQILHTREHCTDSSLTPEELVCLAKEENKLVDSIDHRAGSFKAGYFVGLSWMIERQRVLQISPKLDNETQKLDYLRLLSESLKHPEALTHGKDLFEIQFDQPSIEIRQQDDLITPLIVVYFLQTVQTIVRKGLKKGYYHVERNLQSAVKGKVLVAQTVKQNVLKNRALHTICSYDEFGINHSENRTIKKALLFVFRYLNMNRASYESLFPVLDFILPAFEKVDEHIGIKEIKRARKNPFFSEYSSAVDLSIMILRRFGYNLNTVNGDIETKTPPYWIDMTKIFEFYVLGKLKEVLGNKDIIFQAKANYGDLDYLRTTVGQELVIDAKYKRIYQSDQYDIKNIRQLSGYARDGKVLKTLSIPKADWGNAYLNCLIVYPDQNAPSTLMGRKLLEKPITHFEKFYKIGISLPTIQ